MRIREFIVSCLTSLMICSLFVFLSCASQSRVDEDGELSESLVGEGGSGDGGISDLNLDDLGGSKSSKKSKKSAKNTEDANLGDLGVPDDKSIQSAAANEAANNPPPAETQVAANTTTGDPLDLPSDVPATPYEPVQETKKSKKRKGESSAAMTSDDSILLAPSDAQVSQARTEEAAAQRTSKRSKGSDFSGFAGYSGGSSSVPQIPAKAFKRSKTLMNRFYFARQGDTAESISSLIYGSSQRAPEISKWNRAKAYKPGRLVFYNSPNEPSDKQMKSLYQERNIAPNEYTIKRGDWLSKIAAKMLGNARSWKELAVTNGLDSPNTIEVGQKLVVYSSLGGGYPPSTVASNENGNSESVGSQSNYGAPNDAPSSAPSFTPPPTAEAPSEVPQMQEQGVPDGAKKKKKPGFNLDFKKIIEQNMIFIVIGAAISLLSLISLAITKRKRANKPIGDDFGDDFGAPKMKRK